MPTRVTRACPVSPCTSAGSPASTRLMPLEPVTTQGGHESLARVTGKEGGAAGMTETARFALSELGVPGRRPACSHTHTHAPRASQQQPKVGVCATAFSIFSHRQLTSGQRLGTVDQMVWVFRAPHSQLFSLGIWHTGCSHQQCQQHILGRKSISLHKIYINAEGKKSQLNKT